jgi:hypothetical protein
MTVYLLSFGAGLLVGVVYSLLDVRSRRNLCGFELAPTAGEENFLDRL